MTSGLPPDTGPVAEPATPPYAWSPMLYAQLPAAPPPAAATQARRGSASILLAIAVLAAVVGASVAVVLVRLDDRQATVSTVAATTSAPTTSTVAPPSTAPTPAPAPVTVETAAAQQAFLSQIEAILQQSAQARAQVKNLVAGVTNGCAVAPGPASEAIGQIIANRRSVLGQAAALDTSSGATAANIRGSLVDALTRSIDADNEYEQWLDYLYSRYFNAYPVGCPYGAVPIDGHYRAASSASAEADVAKRAFVASFNPLARQVGLRTWTDTDF